ncbi:hypothetical protein FVR03_07755 [Pontibacter qinzhouensis]|uniref:Uncharacterized protein n=1 Tax=Pontibacter qinzhouensis TaxID=2603253 RepID=A0A5C8KB04_9BACT|nr:hypothetical protein [Pontibacter qinzhouensis]TXK48746.1 hypothetical protein FVR03_07755 [Pontibacter qinzhouensis]
MNRIFIISLLAIMVLQTFSKVLLIVDYQANKAYIMEFLCINRDKPELACEGKCHLSEQLKKQDDAEKQGGAQNVAKEVQLNLICQHTFSFDFRIFLPSQPAVAVFDAGSVVRPSFDFFHPPQGIV